MKQLTLFIAFLLTSYYLSAQTTILMKKENGLFKVECKVNGIPMELIYDTGATNVTISLTEAKFMSKNGALKREDLGEKIYSSIANGDIIEGSKLNIKEIEFGGLKLYNVEALIVHTEDAPLLLGQSAIERLGPVTMEGNRLTVINGKNNSYNFQSEKTENKSTTSEYIPKATGSISDIKIIAGTNGVISNPYDINFSGIQNVYSSAHILDSPKMTDNTVIGFAANGQVEVLEQVNKMFYLVQADGRKGYLWSGWFKK